MNKLVGAFLGSLLLASAIGGVPVVAGSAPNDHVAPKEARQAAAWQVLAEVNADGSNSRWHGKHLQLGPVTDVYDPAGKLVAYFVPVRADGQPTGYVMVSAFLDEEPILAWTERSQPFGTAQMKDRLGATASMVASEKVVWLGGVRFAAQYTLRDGTTRLVDETGIEGPSRLKDSYPAPTSRNDQARERWNLVNKIVISSPGQRNPADGVTEIDPATWEADFLTIHRNYIGAMDAFNQKQWCFASPGGVCQSTGCSPTAGSNIMAYWAAHGFPTLNPSHSQRDIVMALRTTMGTTQNGSGDGITQFWKIDDGLQAYARNNGRGNAVATNHDLANFSTVVTEVDAGRPSLQSYWGQSYFGNHTVTVVGYKEFVRSWWKPNSYYVVVRNNWSSDTSWNLYVRWGTWNSNVVTTFQP